MAGDLSNLFVWIQIYIAFIAMDGTEGMKFNGMGQYVNFAACLDMPLIIDAIHEMT